MTVGHRNMFMVGCHVGHDARIGNGCTVVNNALVAGHVGLGDDCILSGHTAVQQRVRVGRLAMLAGSGATSKDIPPFILQQGYNCVTGLNLVGIRRAGFSTEVDRRPSAGLPDPLPRRDAPCLGALEQIESDFGQFPRSSSSSHSSGSRRPESTPRDPSERESFRYPLMSSGPR